MFKLITTASLAILMFVASHANAALIVDTGTPNPTGLGSILTGNDFFAGQVTFSQDSTISSIQTYLTLDGPSGFPTDSFTVALYNNTVNNTVGSWINSFTANYSGTEGWNGVYNISQLVSAGKYWVAFEGDSSGANYIAADAPNPLALTAFASYSAYSNSPMKFALQVDAVAAVPEADSYAMFLAGLGLLGFISRRRKNEQA
jgi:MYXO-CTERM domain-containing protein